MANFQSAKVTSVKNLVSKLLCILIVGMSLVLNGAVWAQNPTRFAKEVSGLLAEEPKAHSGDLIIFTGSSSVRGWKSLSADFPHDNVINRGFGGSQMSDLLAYLDELVIKHKPSVVFIYEGDNDIAAGESPEEIMNEARQLTESIRVELPDTELVFISAKPSILRWNLKPQYIEFNEALEAYAKTDRNIHYADVWTPMLYTDGSLNKALYVEDGLHMNLQGYVIWAETMEPIMSKFRNNQ